MNSFNPELQLKDTEIETKLIDLLSELKKMKGEYVRSKNFGWILVPEDNENQNRRK